MKFAAKSLLFLIALAGLLAHANNIPQVQHVIIVVQENRTPTNLFQQDLNLIANGAHIVTSLQVNDECGHSQGLPLQSTGLWTCWDTGHNHSPDWVNMWDNGKMDGACKISVGSKTCTPPACATSQTCPYTFVANDQTSAEPGILDPYFQIANQFGFANFMFQTNQGPSFPAHQFLFSGTSAPVRYLDPNGNCSSYPNEKCWQWFDAENPNQSPTACAGSSGGLYKLIDSNSNENYFYTPPAPVNQPGFPCYTHDSLPTLLDQAGVSWRYYLRETYNGFGIWTGPADIYDICGPTGFGGTCKGSDYQQYVQSVLPGGTNYPKDFAPILTDIEHCNLPRVSWVIPDGNWSDHASWGSPPGDGGPSWAAAIVNAVGNATGCDANGYWSDTVILITWDDWGGYYDDVVPPNCGPGQSCGYFNGDGNGVQYVYGFRVPLLVVGAYAKPGYISGANVNPKNLDCLQNTYCHDFGSILNFIEYAFDLPQGGIGDPRYPYADAFVMDTQPSPPNNYSLYDFFDFKTSHSFVPITGAKYPEDCFHHPSDSGCFPHYPVDPDNDANEPD